MLSFRVIGWTKGYTPKPKALQPASRAFQGIGFGVFGVLPQPPIMSNLAAAALQATILGEARDVDIIMPFEGYFLRGVLLLGRCAFCSGRLECRGFGVASPLPPPVAADRQKITL